MSTVPTASDPEGPTEMGLQVEMVVGQPGNCPVAAVSGECGVTVTSVARSSAPEEDCEVTEFTMPADAEPTVIDVSPIYATGSKTRYRCLTEPRGQCACEFVEAFGCPVNDVHAVHGDLYVTFFAPDMETVREIVTRAREAFDGVRLRHLSHSGDLSEEDPVVVDRERLTDRQREVIETAFEMGYFEHPKRANAGEVANALGIATSTFSEHLAAAQGKLLAAVLDA